MTRPVANSLIVATGLGFATRPRTLKQAHEWRVEGLHEGLGTPWQTWRSTATSRPHGDWTQQLRSLRTGNNGHSVCDPIHHRWRMKWVKVKVKHHLNDVHSSPVACWCAYIAPHNCLTSHQMLGPDAVSWVIIDVLDARRVWSINRWYTQEGHHRNPCTYVTWKWHRCPVIPRGLNVVIYVKTKTNIYYAVDHTQLRVFHWIYSDRANAYLWSLQHVYLQMPPCPRLWGPSQPVAGSRVWLRCQPLRPSLRIAGSQMVEQTISSPPLTVCLQRQRINRSGAVYLETHRNIGSKRAFSTGVLDRWHNCLLIYWCNAAQLSSPRRFVYFWVMTQQDVHGHCQRLPKIWVGTLLVCSVQPRGKTLNWF